MGAAREYRLNLTQPIDTGRGLPNSISRTQELSHDLLLSAHGTEKVPNQSCRRALTGGPYMANKTFGVSPAPLMRAAFAVFIPKMGIRASRLRALPVGRTRSSAIWG